MKYITLKSEAQILVPKRLWPLVRRGLQRHLKEREKDHGETFATHSDRVSLHALPMIIPTPNPGDRSSFRAWWVKLIIDVPAGFYGDLIFNCAE